MKVNPFGASCGTSMVTVPSSTKPSARLGTSRARLSDTISGKAPKRERTAEELESMAKHPAGKALTKRDEAREHGEGCKCYCTVVKRQDSEILDLLGEIESMAQVGRAQIHAQIAERLRNEGDVEAKRKADLAEHLRLMGDSDA